MKRTGIAWSLLSLLSSFLVLVPAQHATAQALKEQLVGTWKLVKWTFDVDGVEEPPSFGPDTIGILIFSADGFMCVNLMQPNRPNFATKDWRGGTADEKRLAYETFTGYCASYTVNEEEKYMVSTLETAVFPNWTGSKQKRFLEMHGDQLTARTPPLLIEGKQTVGVLVFEKAK